MLAGAVKFQSTLPCGERRLASDFHNHLFIFQSTLPCGERQGCRKRFMRYNHFNPRSRVGSDGVKSCACRSRKISIHAPVWGATTRPIYNQPTRSQFQSTLPCGERLSRIFSRSATERISIHAPVWGATPTHIRTPRALSDFNPRSRVGSDSGRTHVSKHH